MDERRFKLHVLNSLKGTPIPEEDYYSEEEFNIGYHYCQNWDGLFIAPGSPEWECCTCHPLKNK